MVSSILNFSLGNPEGNGQGDVAKLLRSLADVIEAMVDVQVQEITFASADHGRRRPDLHRLLSPRSAPSMIKRDVADFCFRSTLTSKG